MDIEPQNFFQILREHSEDKFRGPSECLRLLSILNYNLTEEQLNASLIDLYLLHIFDRTNGLSKFVLEVAPNSDFDNATAKSLEIIYTLINNFSNKIEQYILDINEKSLKVLQSKASAKIKAKAVDVLLISFEKVDKCLENQEKYLAIFDGIKGCLIRAIDSDSVRQKEFIAVGLFMKRFSYLISDPNTIKIYFMDQLDNQMAKGPAQGIINGIFTGLAYFCESFPLSLENRDDVAIVGKLYKYIEDLSKVSGTVRIGNRAAITYFASNLNLFAETVVKKYKPWHKRLLIDWLKMGTEEKKVAEKALRALLLAVAESVSKMEKTECMPILTHFINWFKSIIRNSNASYTERKLCVQGLKYFSSPLYKHYEKEEARKIFLLVMQSFEKLYVLNGSTENEEWEFLPDYVQCLASFMRYQSFTNSELYCLQRSMISMIQTFHKLKPLHHSVVIEALVTTLFYLKGTKHFDTFLENIVYQGVVWSCSHQHITDSELASEREQIVTVKNYFPLWRGLLKLVSNHSYDKVSIYFEDRQYILRKTVNELVKTLMILINKLNVNVKLKEDIIETDIETAYQVEQSGDFAIFLNVTDFYQEAFNNIEPEMFRYCICKIINHLVAKCLKYPLVSGFYKLLSFALKISNNLKLFDKGNVTLNQDVANCKETLSKFMSFLLHKMKQFKDELLISCLHVLLESPLVLVEALLPECAGIFITVFEVGRSYMSLANMGLTTLERWQESVDKNEFETFLLQVIPCLDSYLRSKSLGGFSQTNTTTAKKRKTAQGLKKRTVLVELEPELVKFQKRVLHFVGSQNSKICEAFVSPDHNFERKVTSDNLHLKVTIPYADLSLDIHLEPFIMRVVEISLYSSDRKTRVTACELLQAFVVVFLGRTKQMAHSSLSDLDDLLRNLAMPLLQLACDVDHLVRQIFEPLFMQLIHWYTSKMQRESPHLAVLIEVLMEGVTHPTNSSLRDFSGRCINEFVKWTIKQHSETELKNDPLNIKVLVKRMRFFSGHPDLTKKLGAALIFNNIYKEIREERALISIFSMELLHVFVCSLALLDYSNEEVDNVVLQITNAVGHLKRIFVEKPQIFRVEDTSRRVPSDIPEGNLIGLSKWLLSMTACRSKYCRDVSMDLFVHLQPLSGSKASPSAFVEEFSGNLLSIYADNLKKYTTLGDVTSFEDCTILQKWLQSLLCLVDGYIFVIKHSLCTVHLEDKQELRSILYFLKNVQTASIEQGLKLIYKNSTLPYYTAENKEQFLYMKSSCNVAILKLSLAILNDEVLRRKSAAFWNRHHWNLILNFVFNPSSLGIDEKVCQTDYLDVLTLLLNILPRKLNEQSVEELVTVLKKYVSDHFETDIDLRRNISLRQRNIIKGLLLIQRTQLNKFFATEEFAAGLVDKLINSFTKLLDDNTIYIGKLSEITAEHCCLILKLALNNPQEFTALLPHLYGNISVNCQEMTDIDSQMTFGIYLLKKFADPIAKFIVADFGRFLGGSDDVEQVVKLTSYLVKYLDENKTNFRSSFGRVAEGIGNKWFLFQMYFEENSIDLGLEFVRQVYKTFEQNLGNTDGIQKWVLSLLGRDEILLSEQEGVNLYLSIFNVLAEIVDDDADGLSTELENLKSKLEPSVNAENTTLTEKLLTFLTSTKSQIVFKFLIEFYVNHTSVVKNDIDLTDLLKTFMSKSTEQIQGKVLETIYRLSIDESKSFDQKKRLVDNVLPYIFKHSIYEVFETFFQENIVEIMQRLENPIDFGNGLVDFSLVELLFLRIPVGSKERTHCSITEASGYPNLRTQLLKSSLTAFKNHNIEGSNDHSRIYKCGAYKALASIVSNSIKSESFYEKLFVREENGEDILWSALVDTGITYCFPMDFDSYPKRRKILVNIRDELRRQGAQNGGKSLRYIESQRLFNSSLSEDVTKFDFTTSILRTHPVANRPDAADEDDEDNISVETTLIQGELYLEATEINNHELMGTVCGIIEHIFASGVCQLPEDDEEMVECPKWIEGIRRLLLDPKTHKNVKIFWVKVIDNMIHIFRFFAKYFVEPLLQFLNDKIAGSTVNYFVSDVIVVLASWTSLIQPNEKEAKLASDFLGHLISNLTNERKDAFKYHLDLIKLVVENWKNYLDIPYANLWMKLNLDVTSRAIEVGIHLAAICLVTYLPERQIKYIVSYTTIANGVLPCEEKNIPSFWKKLTGILASSVTSIYKPCAETIGLMLKYFKMHEMEHASFASSVSKTILSFQDSKDLTKYPSCLEGVAIHYTEIVDSYHIIKLLNRLSQYPQNLQIIFLKIIFKRADILGDIDCFKNEDWSKYLESQNAEVQLITLEIILKTFQILKGDKSFKQTLKSVTKNLLNPNIFCRGRMYDIFMAILGNGDVEDEEIRELCKEVLIQGLVDTDIETRQKIQTFWSENPSIPSAVASKFPYLMSNFYLAKTEDHFLGYVSYFLLDSIISEEYEKELFEHPLDDCDFEEYKLQTNWRLQHPSVVPMFAETLRTYTEGLDDVSSVNFGALRATQDNYTFAPTQQSLRERHISQISSLESSLIGASVGESRTDKFVNPNAVQLSDKYKLPKRRFLRDKAKISAGFAHLAVAQNIQKVVKRYDAMKESEKKVTIYRSYRKGDFPDIQITLGCLVKPLQMLVLHDSELSKILFSTVYKTLKDKLKNANDDFTQTVLIGIKRIFTDSIQYNANVFSTLLDILLKSKREIRMDPGLISTVCQQSGLVSVGTLLIEEYLMSIEDAPSSSKRGIGSDNEETRHWLKLAELYKELHEWNLVRTIFLEKSNCKEDVHIAIILESEKRWREAQESYEQLVNVDLSPERQDFYYESYFKCLAHLGEWEKLPKAVESLVPEGGDKTWKSLWDNDWFQQKVLPWYIGANVKNTLFSGQNCAQFLLDINEALSDPGQAEYMKNKFSEELCVLWLTQKDTAQATQYLKTSLENFLNDWQLLNPMFGHLRYNKILNLRTLIEIDRFLDTERSLVESTGEERLKSLQDYWKSTQNDFLPSIVLSEAKLLYRKLFGKLLLERLNGLNQLDLVKDLKKTGILLDISFMNLAVEEGNYYMARKYYREYASMKHPSLTMIYGGLANLYSNLIKNDQGLKLEKLLEALKNFRQVVESTQNDSVLPSLLKIFDISQKVMEVLTNNPELYVKYEAAISGIFGSQGDTPLDVACHSLKTEALKDITESDGRAKRVENQTRSLVKLAYFVQDRQDREQDFALYVLRAMRLGSKEARQLFPCILLMDSLEDELKDIFVVETETIPTWMFLGWIPQLLANVDSCKITAISEIILRIARTYPQAIIYSYRLSKENYSNTDNEFSEETKRLTDELDRLLLGDPVVDKFLTALSKVNVPLATMEYYLKKMGSSTDIQQIIEIRDSVIEFFFKHSSESKHSDNIQGNMYKLVAVFKKEFQDIKASLTIKKIRDMIKAINLKRKRQLLECLKSSARKPPLSKTLKDYCPWLANFSAGRMNLELEIPGQYTGEKLPLVQHHIKISGFCDTVSVMSSLRMPIKVTMLGMDSKEYPFLIKFGEDIRQDQRIQQLFMLMNNIFASDNKSHHLLTYQVVPLTSSLGIIQWVENTVSLDDFINKSLPNKKGDDILNTLDNRYEKFLGGDARQSPTYGLSALKKDRNKVIPFYQGLINAIPLDSLRNSIWSMSLTTESFIAFRNNFIKSYAAICVCQWILGIGDRHLQNSKVCTKNGKVLGIDFGHAFGTATQILPIPELVPIRLTPHIVALMEPLKEKGPFRDVMVECLRSLRENSDPLLATMNVFVQEPSMDWLENAKRFETSDPSDTHQWYPLQKIDQAKKKLQGASSSTILIEDLNSSGHNTLEPQYFQAYVSLVKGNQEFDLRARLSVHETLSVEQQVDSLIDHATDPNLLGRMYIGWHAYV